MELGQQHETRTDKFEHGYLPHYERHIPPTTQGIVFEIGAGWGNSLRMWEAYFTDAAVWGIDNREQCFEACRDVNCILGDATGSAVLNYFGLHSFAVVIDDGSHLVQDIITCFELYWPKVQNGGWYVIEDLGVHATVDPTLTSYLVLLLDLLWAGDGDVSEWHAYEEILFLRKGV